MPGPHPDEATPTASPGPDGITFVKRRGVLQWILAVVLALALLRLVWIMFQSPNLDHETIRRYIFSAAILEGLLKTTILAIVSVIVGIILGTALGVMRLAKNRVLSGIASLYVWFFRGTPLLVQILFWGNLALFFQKIELRIPLTDIVLIRAETNDLVTPFVASILGLGLHHAAYVAEIVRSGVLSVDVGQTEAASSLGMRSSRTFRFVVLPQAMRVIIPPMGSQFISALKETSLVSVIAGGDVLTAAQNIAGSTFRVMEMLIVASTWYLLATSLASVGQMFIERRFSRGWAAARAGQPAVKRRGTRSKTGRPTS